jgi:uncharacterized C2H2 Zn-finger protein
MHPQLFINVNPSAPCSPIKAEYSPSQFPPMPLTANPLTQAFDYQFSPVFSTFASPNISIPSNIDQTHPLYHNPVQSFQPYYSDGSSETSPQTAEFENFDPSIFLGMPSPFLMNSPSTPTRSKPGRKSKSLPVPSKCEGSTEGSEDSTQIAPKTNSKIKPCNPDEPIFGCPVCGAEFSRKNSMRRHVLTHINLRPYNCVTCQKSFYRSDIYKRHLSSKKCRRAQSQVNVLQIYRNQHQHIGSLYPVNAPLPHHNENF